MVHTTPMSSESVNPTHNKKNDITYGSPIIKEVPEGMLCNKT
jgi:hypothetical protein